MLYLALAVGCSLAIGMIFKHAARQSLDRLALLTCNYAAALGLALGLLALGGAGAGGGLAVDVRLVALGTATGALFILGFFLLALATEVAGMSLAIGVMRTSVVVPFVASWLIWDEVPSPAQGAGLVLAGAAFFLIARKDQPAARPAPQPLPTGALSRTSVEEARTSGEEGRTLDEERWTSSQPPRTSVEGARTSSPPSRTSVEEGRTSGRPPQTSVGGGLSGLAVFGVLAGLFACDGVVSVSMKAFDEAFAAESSRALFLMMVFGIAFLIGLALVLVRGVRRGRWPGRAALGWGALLGVANYGSVEFLLGAIRQLSGPFVFPANNIALVIGAALLGVYVWGEHLSRLNRLGLALAAVALLLLNL